jgi:type IV pilus assembly protein PilQ
MKKHTLLYLLLLTPIALWAQAGGATPEEIDLSDVVVVKNVPISERNLVLADDATTAAPTVVEIPDAPVDGASIDLVMPDIPTAAPTVVEIPDAPVDGASVDLVMPDIPTASEALPTETEVVLELPGQEFDGGEAVMADEETISVDFPDEDVRTILRNVADLFDLNLVIPDTLQGRTSIKLANITWAQVFEVVLEPLGFTYVTDRNIIRIKSIEELTTEPVDTRVFVVNYANAEDLQNSIGPLVDNAAGGLIQIDARSNALVITERPSRMNKIQEIIERLDKATDQVMIESKFIEITNTDVKNIGVNWASMNGYSASAGPFQRAWTRGRSTDASSSTSNSYDETFEIPGGLSVTDSTSVVDSLARVASSGRMDSALFSADEFKVVLSALEEEDDIKLVSNPTVVTLNNTAAKIVIGEQYPIPQFSFVGDNAQPKIDDYEFKDIGIKLDVTPHVNSAGFINLQIIPEVSSRIGSVVVENAEIPIIASRRTESTIVVKDGYTLAIGGLVENTTKNGSTKVPLLGDLPGLGRLFSSDSDEITQRNLIIFITAKTLNPDGSTYKDVIDPRVIDDMGLVPSELPGYQPDMEERNLLKQLEDYRIEKNREETVGKQNARILEIEQQKLEAEARAKALAEAEAAKKKSTSRTR